MSAPLLLALWVTARPSRESATTSDATAPRLGWTEGRWRAAFAHPAPRTGDVVVPAQRISFENEPARTPG